EFALCYTPLSAKIYAYLTFDFEKQGFTFDELIEIFSVSKGAISQSLKFLLKQELIIENRKIDERKRYFTINDNFRQIRMRQIINKLEKEMSIMDRLEAFHGKEIPRYTKYKEITSLNVKNMKEALENI
ncbi:MAG: ArsR family transcriptional regulator, partial [Bergeyella zoohelcum]|nr:ArsR family transcriptional regulator [Bergeyella zoohelcum]